MIETVDNIEKKMPIITLKELVVITICCLLFLSIVFYPAFWQGRMIYGEDEGGSDCFDLNVPRRYLAVDSIKNYHELPFWISSFSSGCPLLEEGEAAVLYPFSLLPYFVFSVPTATNVVVFSALMIAMLGMYAWLRYNGAVPLAAFCGALAWGCGGFLFRLKHLNIIHVMAWLPMSMLLVQLLVERGKAKYYCLLLLVWVLQISACHPQIFFISQVADWLFIICLLLKQRIVLHTDGTKPFKELKCIAVFASVLVFSIILGAVQLYPTYDLWKVSNRSDRQLLNDLNNSSLCAYDLKHFVYPFASGNPAGQFCNNTQWDYNHIVDIPYIGLLSFVLVIGALYEKRSKITVVIIIICCLCLWLALGPKGRLYTVLWHVVPFFANFRCVARFLVPVSCCLGFLAGLGTQCVYDRISSRYGDLKGRIFLVGAVCLVTVDFAHINWSFQSYLPAEWFQAPSSIAAVGNNRGRVLAPLYTMSWKSQMRHDNYCRREQVCYEHRNQLGPELSSLWGIQNPDDYIAYNCGVVCEHSFRLQVFWE